MTRRLYLHHGWGYDASFWQPLLRHLPNVTPTLVDEGYHGTPSTPPLPDTPYWAVGHSAGVMALLAQELPGCCGIIAFNGFAQFCQHETFPHGIPSRVIDRMGRRVSTHPGDVLRSFRALCNDPSPMKDDRLNSESLKAGLERLRLGRHPHELSRWNGRLYSLIGTCDPLTPAQKGLPFPAHRSYHTGGHVLPLTDPEDCAAFLETIIASHD